MASTSSASKPYGGLTGAESSYVKLLTNDGHEFIIKRELAKISPTIQAMLSGPGEVAEDEVNEISFKDIPSHVMVKVCHYFAFKERYTNSACEIPDFPLDISVALEVLMTANFLEC